MRVNFRLLALLLAAMLFASGSLAKAQTAQELQTKFEQEDDVVRRAKMMVKLSRADFHEISQQMASGDDTNALTRLQQLVDDAQSCSTALDEHEKNPESHSNGFKQLQIAMRESLRRLDDLTVSLTRDEQAPFLAIRKKMDLLNRHLIHELFPRQPLPPSPPDSAGPDPSETTQ